MVLFAADSNFKQQRLKAWQPILTASTALPLFFIIGIVFIPIGAILLVASDKVSTNSYVTIKILQAKTAFEASITPKLIVK